MNNNKRQRTDDEQVSPAPAPPPSTTARGPKLRLSNELATKLGTRHCTENELVRLMLSQKLCSRVSTFEVKATLVGDLNVWMTITLADEHASTADVKAGVEQAKGIRPAMQELFRYDDSWTGTDGSGGSGHSAAQEDAALVEEGLEFEGPCSLMVSVNEAYAVVLEGQEEDEARHLMMGAYERVENREVNGRGVWQLVGGINRFLYYHSSKKQWLVSDKGNMEADKGNGSIFVKSTAATPDQTTEQWQVNDDTAWHNAPNLRVRVCSSVEKHAAEQRVEQESTLAQAQAQQARQLVVEGLEDDIDNLMDVYELMEGKLVNRRAVWQKQGGAKEWFMYYSSGNGWVVSTREHMEVGSDFRYMQLITAALTPDQNRPSDVWMVCNAARTQMVDVPEVQVQRQT
jgi:hypothetical protein